MNKSEIENLHWHDGIIRKLVLESDENSKASKIFIHASLIDDSTRSPNLAEIELEYISVSKFNAICDLVEIAENKEHGNIHDFSIKGNNLRIILFDGYIDISAKEYHVKKS